MRTPEFKVQPTNAFFATVNQILGGSSQFLTAASSIRGSGLANLDLFFNLFKMVAYKRSRNDDVSIGSGGRFSSDARDF